MAPKKKNEIIAFIWFALAIFSFICIVSYTPSDIGLETSSPNQPAENWAGIVGAYFAWALHWVFGRSSFLITALFASWAVAQWSGKKIQGFSLKLFSGALFFVSASSMLSLAAGPARVRQFEEGGVLGYFAAQFLKDIFGQSAFFISMTLFVLSVLLATEFLVLPVVLSFSRALAALVIRSQFFKTKSTRNGDKPGFILPGLDRFLGKKEAELPTKVKIKLGDALEPKPASSKKGTEPIFDNKDQPEPVEKKKEPIIHIARREVTPPEPAAKETVLRSPARKAAQAGEYRLPPLEFLIDSPQAVLDHKGLKVEIEEQSRILEETLADFGIEAKVVEVERGPVITRFELQPASGVKVQRISALQDNISLALKATSVRIIAPIPGKARVGVEVPNSATSAVVLKEIITSPRFKESKSKLTVALGKDTAGTPIVADLDDMPHLLIAGSTGSGKTVCVNTIIMSLLYNASPDDVKMVLIDPKMVEFTAYNGLPHLVTPVITESQKVPSVLHWLVSEMENRYRVLSDEGARNIKVYNERRSATPTADKSTEAAEDGTMPYIVVFIDELADLMLSQGKEIEITITRLAQLARAVGIHLVFATQRPSVDVITGVIKANFPARISFQVASKVDSRTVLDINGADQLLGKGDMLFLDPRIPKPIRAQGALVTDAEIDQTVHFIKNQRQAQYLPQVVEAQPKGTGNQDFRDDELYWDACKVIVSSGQASVSMLQRKLGLGYTRAARLVDMMEEDGIVGPNRGAKPREILMDLDTLLAKEKASASPAAQSPAGADAGKAAE